MERLTERDEYGNADVRGVRMEIASLALTFTEFNNLTNALNRLAAYEDTGFTPEELRNIRTHETLPIDPKRLLEILEAERTGRMVVLDEPRKPLVWGDDAHDTVLCPNCNRDLMGGFPEGESCEIPMYQCPYCGQPIDDEKALTRQEAEEAPKERAEK